MRRRIPVAAVFAIGLFIFFFLDGSISQVCSGLLYAAPNSLVPYLTVLWLVLTDFFTNSRKLHLLMWAAVIGFIFDMYYVGILGVYVFVFPLVIYLGQGIYETMPRNFLSGFLVYFIDITLTIGLDFLANVFIGQVEPSATIFLVNTLAPTLAINLLFFAVLYFPIESLYLKYRRRG
ncbi:rod shape-determining protein MreD [Lentilactobacillus sp. Marseille-Q4993]|uniref:rod shape-determining protein MreD n=1 Tax=Lentilactobacillus sp. Marseille-Q4993 TaxID=3039492 RepID=UPI0024BCC771|nr:rod shape-determining protein MreD [Lentilactobacillus sp. Marseille-Q4993]